MNDLLLGIKVYFREVPKFSVIMWCVYLSIAFFGGYKLYHIDSELFWAVVLLATGWKSAGNVFRSSMDYVKNKVHRETAEAIFSHFNED